PRPGFAPCSCEPSGAGSGAVALPGRAFDEGTRMTRPALDRPAGAKVPAKGVELARKCLFMRRNRPSRVVVCARIDHLPEVAPVAPGVTDSRFCRTNLS